MPVENRYFGKYRANLTDNIDPLQLGRVKVEVPAVNPGMAMWAMPCVPYAGRQVGLVLVPPIGAKVWVEFEGGDPAAAIWVGCFWEPGDRPKTAADQQPDLGMALVGVGYRLEVAAEGKTRGLLLSIGAPLIEEPITIEATETGIALKRKGASIEMTKDGITVMGGDPEGANAALELNRAAVRLRSNPAGSTAIRLDESSVEIVAEQRMDLRSQRQTRMQTGTAAIALTPTAVELGTGPASVKLSPGAVILANGASQIAMNPATVNINNGALEVI